MKDDPSTTGPVTYKGNKPDNSALPAVEQPQPKQPLDQSEKGAKGKAAQAQADAPEQLRTPPEQKEAKKKGL